MSDDDSDGSQHVDAGEAKKEFRFQAKRCLLTYSQVDGKIEDHKQIIEGIGNGLPPDIRISRWVCGREHHRDGGLHFHCYLEFTAKVNSRDPRLFDVRDCHPNIRRVKDPKRAIAYAMKDGDFAEDRIDMVLWPTWQGYGRNKADYDQWLIDRRATSLKAVVWPVHFAGITDWERSTERLRHLCIVGPFAWGKTTALNNAFDGLRIFVRAAGCDTPFECYRDEEVVAYDDHIPKYEELVSVCNVWRIPVPVYGRVRYTNRFWKRGQARMVVILCNELPDYGSRQSGFLTRFRVHRIVESRPVPAPEHVEEGCPV